MINANINIADYLIDDETYDNTIRFQQAINDSIGSTLYVTKPKFSRHYLLGSLSIPSNTHIVFDPGVILRAKTLLQTKPYECFFVIRDSTNVTIDGNGAIFEMIKSDYSQTEHNHCFALNGSTHVKIDNVITRDSGGDGFYIGNYLSVKRFCEDIKITNCIADNHRRQGMSVISVDGLIVEGCIFKNTIGAAPEAGVDVEPNSELDVLKRIRFNDCLAMNNAGRGFNVFLMASTPASSPVDVVFDNCRTVGNMYGFGTTYSVDGGKGRVLFDKCITENAKMSGFFETSCSADGVLKIYRDCVAINCNESAATGNTLSFSSSFFINDTAAQPRTSIGNSQFINCKSIEDREVKMIKRGFATISASGAIPRKIKFIDCESVGHITSMLEISPTARDIHIQNNPSPVLNLTSSTSIAQRYTGYEINNKGTTSIVSCTLPASSNWVVLTFRVEANQLLKIAPPQALTGTQIFTTSAPNKALQSSNIGDTVTLRGRDDGHWDVVQRFGNWVEV